MTRTDQLMSVNDGIWRNDKMVKSHCRCTDGVRYTITIGSSSDPTCLGYNASYEALRMLAGAGKDIVVSFEIDQDGKPTNVRAETR